MENGFHSAFEVWKKTMGSLYTFPRRIFWRRWQPKLSKLSQRFFFNVVQELPDTPHVGNTFGHLYQLLWNSYRLQDILNDCLIVFDFVSVVAVSWYE
jgi:hypothetical protein